jgi:hypothetical protein
MCEECGEAPVQFVAYFNEPGSKHWRPPQRAASVAAPSQAEPRYSEGSATPISDPTRRQPTWIGGGEKQTPAFVCEETRAE